MRVNWEVTTGLTSKNVTQKSTVKKQYSLIQSVMIGALTKILTRCTREYMQLWLTLNRNRIGRRSFH